MKSPPTTLVLTCTGNIADEDLEDRLTKITAALKDLSETDNDAVNLSKVEPWNSVRVTFNIPPEAAARLRELAQRGDPNLHKLGILSVQVENGEAISLPPAPANEAQRSLFSPLPSTPSSTPQLSLGTPIVPPSPSPVMASPLNPSSTATPATMVAGLSIGSGGGLNFPMPGVNLQQLTRPPLQGLPGPGPGSMFPQQGAGNLWNAMNAPQQRPIQPPPASFWNQIPQFFPQVNMAQPNQQQNVQAQTAPTLPTLPTPQQAKAPVKKRRKRTKKANIQPPELAVAAGQPLLPLPPHLQSLPPTTTPDNIDSFNTSKPSNLILPPSLIDNPISPNSPPSSSTATSVMSAASVAATSTVACTQFSFTEVPMSRGLVTSPHTQQMQLLQKKTDVALTSPLLVNLLQSDISSKQFPLANTSGGKTIGTITPTTGQLGPFSQEALMATPPTTALSTSSPFTIGNSVGTLGTPNIPNNIPPFLTSQGNILSQISSSGQFTPTNPMLQANIGHLSQEQIQFQLNQLTSAGQFTQAQMQHGQFMQGHISQSPMIPGQNPMQPNMQTFPMPGGHHSSNPSFPPQMSHIQLPNVRMSIGPISNTEQIPQNQIRPGFMHPGQMPQNQVPIESIQLQQNNLPTTQANIQPNQQLEMIPSTMSVNQMDPWSVASTLSSSTDLEKQRILMELQSKKPKESIPSWNGSDKPAGPPKPNVELNPAFDEEAALRGMTEAERDTMAAAAVIAREAKEAADAKNDKQSPSKDVLPSKPEPQLGDQAVKPVTSLTTSGSFTESSGLSTQRPKSVPSANIASPVTSLSEGKFDLLKSGQLSSRVGPQTAPSSTERRLSNSPVRLSPPKMPENIKQRRTPPSSASRPIPHQQGHYRPISGGSPTSMSSSIAGLQTLTSRTFAPAAQPSIRDMALTRNNPEHNTLSQFLSSVTPPSEILQMAPLFRSAKQQETPPKPMLGVAPSSTAPQSDWLSLPSVEGQKPLLPLPSQIGARTPMHPAEFSAATERMLGSMLDTHKSNISNIERPANQPRVITTEGIKFMHQLVGRPTPSNTTNQGPAKDSSTVKDIPQEQEQAGSAKQDDKSQLKALLNEIGNSEKCPVGAKLQVASTNVADDKNVEKFQLSTTPTSRDSGLDVRQPSSTPPSASPHAESWLGIPNQGTPFPQVSRTKVDTVPQPSMITSMYIPPSISGNQQQRAMFSRPSTEQQLGTSSTTASTVATFETSHLGSLSPFSGLVGDGSKSGPFKNLKEFDQTSPPVYHGQPQAQPGETFSSIEKKEAQFSHSVKGSATNFPGLKLAMPSQHQLQTHSFPTHLPTKSHIPQQPSMQETPMTVLERAPEILLSPTTLSTASKELLESLAAHGTVSALHPAPESLPDVGGSHGPGSDQITQMFQVPTSSKSEAETCTEIPNSSPPDVAPVMINSNSTTEKTMTGTTPNAYSSASVTPTSSTPDPQSHSEQPAGKPGITSQPVITTTESSVASILPAIPTVAVSSASVSAFTPVQQSSDLTDMKQMSLMPLTQLVAATHGPLQSHLSSQPKAIVPITQSLPSLSQSPVSRQSTVNLQENTVLTGEKEQNTLPSQVPKPALQTENPRAEPPSYQQSYPTPKLSEKMSKSSQDEVQRVDPESPSKGVVGEADNNSQHVYGKPSGEKRLSQLRLSPKAGSGIGHQQGPQTTTTSPVKPSSYTSASSTLAQAQSIMVKTAAMSRTSGIMKATEQMSRPVRSRTPPRASLSTLPPTTCNNDSSLGSASALLSSIAKSAWTVTTAMASAAKAKVVPTPKATDKNLIRMRRSPETLPPAGKMATGERGSSSHDTAGLHARQTPNSPAFKNIPKTPTDSSADQMQLMMKKAEGSPGSSRVQIDAPNVTQRDLQFSSAVTKQTFAVKATTSDTVHPTKSLTHSFSNRTESESVPTTQTSPVPPRHIASPLSSSFSTANPVSHPIITTASESQLTTRLKSTKSFIDFTETTPFALAQQAQQQAPPLTETLDGGKLNLSPAESFTFGEWQLSTPEKRAPSDDQKSHEKISMLGQPNKSPAFVSNTTTVGPEEQPHISPKAVSPRGKSPITDTSAPIVPCSTTEGNLRLATPATDIDTPGSDQVNDKSNQDEGSKETDQSVGVKSVDQESAITLPATSTQSPENEGALISSEAVSPSKSELQTGPDPSTLAVTSMITSIPTQASSSSPEPRKRPLSESVEEPPAKKTKESSSPIKDSAQNLAGTPQQVNESISHESVVTPVVTGGTLLEKDSETESIKMLPNTVEMTPDVVKVPELNKFSEDKQEEKVPAGGEASTGIEAVVSAVATTDEAVKSCEGNTENRIEETLKSSSQEEPNKSCEVGTSLDTDIPSDSSLLNKPDQITILVEEVIQKDPESEELLDKSSSKSVSDEPAKGEVSGTDKLEVPSAKSPDKEPCHSGAATNLSEKEQSKEGGTKQAKDSEGEFEPRRTRHTSEEVPGMSLRSLRSGRRSPAEQLSRGKDREKEESPPTTRGRGQKDRDIAGDVDSDGSSRKRSTRSSGRGMPKVGDLCGEVRVLPKRKIMRP
ncbi:uncharacterized protein [Asterias amurensis]|uniref:uncharacterized protein isoform X1 n=1 Tax=Asterias amurensis TaxID=7602 RepID=UPI003AB33BBC